MNELALVVAVCLAALAAIVLAGASPATVSLPRRRPVVARPVVVAVVVTAVGLAMTGWLVPSLVVGVGSGLLTHRRSTQRTDRGDTVERVEALAAWIENVRDVLRAGNQPLGAIGATVDTCPVTIRPAVRAMYARLSSGHSPDVALRRFADDVDDPLADLVAVGLLVAVTRGAETEGALSSLAAQTRHHAERRRIVEAERAPVQREVLMVTVVMCVLLAGLFVFGRSSYLAAYDDAAGQVVLALILVGYVGLISWAARLTRFPRPSRFLTIERVR